ncbi:MAG: DUF1631 domain-containing protein [Sedimenticola sp.]|nr:DUF1631 domain-containing protein [Sedimenticola sp.]
MEEVSSDARPVPGGKSHQQLINECRDQVMVYLTTQLTELFGQVEPAFIDFARKAESDVMQNRFFDSINQILDQREQIEQAFKASINDGFVEFTRGGHIRYPDSPIEARDESELGMVDDDILEQHLAIQSLISKTQNSCYQELYALGKRLAIVRGGKKLSDDDIPACPAHVATAFQEAARSLELDKQIMLIIYFLFGKYVLNDVRSIYQSLNDELIQAGILPNLKLSGLVPPSDRSGSAGQQEPDATQLPGEDVGGNEPSGGSPGPAAGLGEELFKSIHDLLTARRAADPAYRNHPEFSGQDGGRGLLSAPSIAQAIHSLQPSKQADYLPDPDSEDGIPQSIELDTQLIQNVRQTLEREQQKLLDELDREKLPAADLDTIELVGMLFEQVLDEEGLANIAKALISHLHTPYLKVAILDRQFLKDETHIARRLLNLMVDGGKRWIDEEDLRRGVYYPMQEIVKTILSEFKSELSLFDEMLYKLDKQLNELEQRARVLEERNQEAAKGRERLETARTRAREIIQKRIAGRKLHPVLERFLNHAWQDRLILMLLRNPEIEKNKEWTSALAVIDSLARVMEARHNSKVKEWLAKNHDNLVRHIKAGLNSLGNYHHPDSNALFKLIESVLQEPVTPEPMEDPGAEAMEVAEPVIRNLSKEQPAPREEETPALSAEEDQILQELRKMKFGTWFELLDDNQVPRRLKLSWFSPITRKYMFVDRFGMQAYITPAETLATQLCSGKARIIKSNGMPFVSRALKTIHTILKKTIGIQSA